MRVCTITPLKDMSKIPQWVGDCGIERSYFFGGDGLAQAYIAGYKMAYDEGYDCAIEIDEDHGFELWHEFEARIKSGDDCVFGTRFGGDRFEGSKLRKMLSWFSGRLSSFLLRLDSSDATSGFCAYNRKALKILAERKFHSKGRFIQTEVKFALRDLKKSEVRIYYKCDNSLKPFMEVASCMKNLLQCLLLG